MPMIFPKNRLGIFLVALYAIVFVIAMGEYIFNPPEPMQEFGLLMLTLPWSFICVALVSELTQGEPFDRTFLFYSIITLSWILDAVLLYAAGVLWGKFMARVSAKRNK